MDERCSSSRKTLSVERQPQDEFTRLSSELNPIVDGVVLHDKRCMMMSFRVRRFPHVCNFFFVHINSLSTYDIEEADIIIRMEIKWRNMSRLLIPLSMIIVTHDRNPIEVLVELRYIVASVDHRLTGRNS